MSHNPLAVDMVAHTLWSTSATRDEYWSQADADTKKHFKMLAVALLDALADLPKEGPPQ